MFAWLAGQYTAHLCVAGNIRAMPETEIPPVSRGDIYLYIENAPDLIIKSGA